MKNGKMQKGSLIRTRHGIYICVGEIENDYVDYFYFMRVVTKKGRFNIKNKFQRAAYSKTTEDFVSIEEIYVDDRDREILKEFIDYIQNNTFKIEGVVRIHYYTWKNKKEYYYYSTNSRIVNGNFSKFKRYSNHV